MAPKVYWRCMRKGTTLSRRIARAAPSMECPKRRLNLTPQAKYCHWNKWLHGLPICLLKKRKLMADERLNLSSTGSPEPATHPPQYHAMVLLVDDQAMVC